MTPEKEAAERKRLDAMRVYEREAESAGQLPAGVDEAGRGPLAGPVSAGAVILPKDLVLFYLNDSKKVTPKRREVLFGEIQREAVAYGVAMVSEKEIDENGILPATFAAMKKAVGKLSPAPDLLLVDAVTIPGIALPQAPIIKGDAKSVSIAAASILAKVFRDRCMEELDARYPEYGFAAHKGYGTKAHIDAIRKYGLCPLHRRTFCEKFMVE